MKAFGFSTPFSEQAQNYVEELTLDLDAPRDHDLVVEVKGVAVNPVDTKVRVRASASADSPQVLGYDAAGIVRDVGAKVSRFAIGDEVFYAGDITGIRATVKTIGVQVFIEADERSGFGQELGLAVVFFL